MFIDNETIRVTKNGDWLSNGEPITHLSTLEAFQKFVDQDDQGFFVTIGHDSKRIEVEDTALFVRQIQFVGDSIQLQLAPGESEALDLSTLKYVPGRLTCRVRGGKLEAKFLMQPYHELLLRAETEETRHFLSLGSERIFLD